MSIETLVTDIERVPDHLEKVLSLLERWRERVSNELDAVKEGHAPKRDLAIQLGEIAKNSKPIAQEIRAWKGKVKEVVSNLSLEEKLKVSINLIQGLSTGDRYKFYAKLNEIERARDDGGIKLAVTHV